MKFLLAFVALFAAVIAADAAPIRQNNVVVNGGAVVQQRFGLFGGLRSQTIVNGGGFASAAVVNRSFVQRSVIVNHSAAFASFAACPVQAAPVYVQSAPIIQAAPVYVQQAPIVVQSAPVLIQSAPIVTYSAPVLSAPVLAAPACGSCGSASTFQRLIIR